MNRYETCELDVASFLKATGHPLLDAESRGHLVSFAFPPSAEQAVNEYLRGAAISAISLFEAHRSLRALIVKVKNHKSNRINGLAQHQNTQQ